MIHNAHMYIGNEGFPNNHITAVTTTAWYIGLKVGSILQAYLRERIDILKKVVGGLVLGILLGCINSLGVLGGV